MIIAVCIVVVIICAAIATVHRTLKFSIMRDAKREQPMIEQESIRATMSKKMLELLDNSVAELRSMPNEDVFITSFDKLKLHAKLYDCEDPVGTIIMCHGYRSSAVNDFAVLAPVMYKRRYRLLLIDQRATGQSAGKYIGMGALERFDCRDWAWYMYNRFGDCPMFLEGVSMGSTTVLMASGLELPPNVKGIIADCGFTSPKEIFSCVFKASYHLPPHPFVDLMGKIIKLTAKYDIGYSAEEAVAGSDLPILYIHGEADDFVPHYMSVKNHAATKGEKFFVSVPYAGHGMSYLTDTEKCRKALDYFLVKYGQ